MLVYAWHRCSWKVQQSLYGSRHGCKACSQPQHYCCLGAVPSLHFVVGIRPHAQVVISTPASTPVCRLLLAVFSYRWWCGLTQHSVQPLAKGWAATRHQETVCPRLCWWKVGRTPQSEPGAPLGAAMTSSCWRADMTGLVDSCLEGLQGLCSLQRLAQPGKPVIGHPAGSYSCG